MIRKPVRLALIGSGKMGSVHARNVAANPDAALVAVAGGSRAAELAGRYGAERLTVDEVFGRPDIDGVVIASPNGLHAEHLLGAVAGGKAVLVEKPVDLDLARVDDCIRQVGSASDRVIVAFNRRFDPSFASARARVVAGEIGAVTQLLIVSRDPAPPPLEYIPGSGGIFRDMTIHDLDLARHFVGEISSVSATAQSTDPRIAELGDADGATVTLVAASGAIVTIVNARANASGYDQRLEALGTDGTIAVGNLHVDSVRRSGHAATDSRGPLISHYADRYADAYRAEIAHLIRVARREEASRCTLADGRHALALADAAAESTVGELAADVRSALTERRMTHPSSRASAASDSWRNAAP